MRFALLGDHRDGLDFAAAVAASGRHELRLYSGPAPGLAHLQRLGIAPRSVGELEEVLSDAALDAVIVASGPALRAGQLRRALQSEFHVLCVHPADPSPDLAYEAALLQADAGFVLLPLLPAALHPGFAGVGRLVQAGPPPRFLELEIWSTEEVLLDAEDESGKPGLPAWDVLRLIGGEIAEVYLQTTQAELLPGQPLLLSGRFLSGLVFQATYVPEQSEARWRLSLVTTTGRATLSFEQGWPGPSCWTHTDEGGAERTEKFEPFDPWSALLEHFEQEVDVASIRRVHQRPLARSLVEDPPALAWQDELRALELDDAARRSAEKGRVSTLDLQETTEEATFKGTMTLVGCSLIWLTLVVLIVSVWVPPLAWAILPLLAIFMAMQALRWVVPTSNEEKKPPPAAEIPPAAPDTRIRPG